MSPMSFLRTVTAIFAVSRGVCNGQMDGPPGDGPSPSSWTLFSGEPSTSDRADQSSSSSSHIQEWISQSRIPGTQMIDTRTFIVTPHCIQNPKPTWAEPKHPRDIDALMQRMLIAWGYAPTPLGYSRVQERISQQLTSEEARYILTHGLRDNGVKNIIERTETRYVDPEVAKVIKILGKEFDIKGASAKSLTIRAMKEEGMRGHSEMDIATHVAAKAHEIKEKYKQRTERNEQSTSFWLQFDKDHDQILKKSHSFY